MTGTALAAHVVVRRHGFDLDARIDAAPGETVAVMGPSGAGKSTLLAAIAGLARLDGGSVRLGETIVAGEGVHVPPDRRGVVLLGQDARLFPHLSARENVAFGPRAKGADKATARRDADDWLARVGLEGAGARHPDRLSGGQQQRVALARALAASPRVLLLDEPLTSLDVETAADVRALLRSQLAATRATAVVVSHDATDAAALADRLVVIEAGRVVQDGRVDDVLGTPATRFIAAVAAAHRWGGTP